MRPETFLTADKYAHLWSRLQSFTHPGYEKGVTSLNLLRVISAGSHS